MREPTYKDISEILQKVSRLMVIKSELNFRKGKDFNREEQKSLTEALNHTMYVTKIILKLCKA